MFTLEQTQEILKILSLNHAIYIGGTMGESFLTLEEKELLKSKGINVEDLYQKTQDPYFLSFQLGILAETLGVPIVNSFSYEDFLSYIRKGQYIPLTKREEYSLQVVKSLALNDIKTIQGKIFTDVNHILVNGQTSQGFLKEELQRGIKEGLPMNVLSHEISEKTGDWGRNFDRIVAYNSHLAYERGKAGEMIERYGPDVLVYKRVYPKACKHCIKLYLKAGIGSEPIIFKLEDLINNGDNIGRKVAEWKPVLGPTHPHCRCNVCYVDKNSKWDQEKKKFVFNGERLIKRRQIKVSVGGKEFMA